MGQQLDRPLYLRMRTGWIKMVRNSTKKVACFHFRIAFNLCYLRPNMFKLGS